MQHGSGQDNYEHHTKSQNIVLRVLLVFRSEDWVLSPHSCGSLDGAMLNTQKAGASYM